MLQLRADDRDVLLKMLMLIAARPKIGVAYYKQKYKSDQRWYEFDVHFNLHSNGSNHEGVPASIRGAGATGKPSVVSKKRACL